MGHLHYNKVGNCIEVMLGIWEGMTVTDPMLAHMTGWERARHKLFNSGNKKMRSTLLYQLSIWSKWWTDDSLHWHHSVQHGRIRKHDPSAYHTFRTLWIALSQTDQWNSVKEWKRLITSRFIWLTLLANQWTSETEHTPLPCYTSGVIISMEKKLRGWKLIQNKVEWSMVKKSN